MLCFELLMVVGRVLMWPFVGWDVLATSVSYICQMKGKHKSSIGYFPPPDWPLLKWNTLSPLIFFSFWARKFIGLKLYIFRVQ